MKHRPFRRWMIRWAFAATLALVLVPTIGRLAGLVPMPMHHGKTTDALAHAAQAHVTTHASDHGMPGAHGRAIAHTGTHGGSRAREAADSPTPTGSTPQDADEDCAYCPLLLGTIALPVPVLLATLPLRNPAMPIPALRSPVLERHPTGLGSRGPPLAG